MEGMNKVQKEGALYIDAQERPILGGNMRAKDEQKSLVSRTAGRWNSCADSLTCEEFGVFKRPDGFSVMIRVGVAPLRIVEIDELDHSIPS